LSREEAQRLIKGGLVFTDGAEVSSASRVLKEGEIISVRHHGRFRFAGENGQTKKDRLSVRIQKYI
jgi:RNA-binding protein YlmH